MCMKASDPETGSRPQPWQRCEPGRQHQVTTCLGSATADSLRPLTALHDHAANLVHCQLGLVQIHLLGHIRGRGSRGAPGSLFEPHWHWVLPYLLLRRAHCPPCSSHFMCPQNRLPPLWPWAAIVHQSRHIPD